MKIAVTGASGMIGAPLSRWLDAEGHEVVKVDMVGENPIDLRYSIPDFQGVEAVFHLAARVGGVDYTHGRQELGIMFDNVAIDDHVLHGCALWGVERIIFASSAAVLFDRDSGYGIAKANAEDMFQHYAEKTGAKASILRLFNVYGPGSNGTHVIPELFAKAMHDKEVRVKGSGGDTRAFLYVDDAVQAFVHALRRPLARPTDIGSDEHITTKELAEKITAIASPGKQVFFDRTKAPPSMVLPDTEAAHKWGWKAKVPLSEGLKQMFNYANPPPV